MMTIISVSRFDMIEVRRIIADILMLPETIIFDVRNIEDVSNIDNYLTVFDTNETDIGTEIRYNGEDEEEIVSVLKEITITVDAYGNDSYEMLCKLTESMKLTPIWQRLKQLSMGYLRCSEIRSLPMTSEVEIKQHAQVDLIFSINPIVKTSIPRGDNVKFKLEVIK